MARYMREAYKLYKLEQIKKDYREKILQEKRSKEVAFHEGSLPLKKKGLTRFIFWPDQQWPHTISIEAMLAFIREFKPDYLVLGGDVMNQDPFDHWSKAKRGLDKLLPDPKPHYDQFQAEFMDPVIKAVAGGSVVFIKGNHEAWADQAVDSIPEGRGYWEIENNVKGVDFWVAQFKTVSLGKLHFAHGDMVNSGVNAAKKILAIYRRSIWVGHHHRVESATDVSPVDAKDKHIAQIIGCWCPLNPHYAQNKPNAWVNGFGYGYVKPDGNFWGFPVYATEKGEFIVEGKEYKVKP